MKYVLQLQTSILFSSIAGDRSLFKAAGLVLHTHGPLTYSMLRIKTFFIEESI